MPKTKAIAVDNALATLAQPGQTVELSSHFIKKWAEAARTLGGSLSANRIETAIRKMNLKVSMTPCGLKHLNSSGWLVNIGKPAVPYLHHTKIVGGNKYGKCARILVMTTNP